jgi:hypothetical protein
MVILAEDFYGFPQSLQANTLIGIVSELKQWPIPSTSFPVVYLLKSFSFGRVAWLTSICYCVTRHLLLLIVSSPFVVLGILRECPVYEEEHQIFHHHCALRDILGNNFRNIFSIVTFFHGKDTGRHVCVIFSVLFFWFSNFMFIVFRSHWPISL